MRLRYDTSVPPDSSPLLLTHPDDVRVEIHFRRDDDGSVTLLAFSGREEQGAPTKTLHQGPFVRFDQAVAAKRAIAAQLKDDGFAVSEDGHPLWSLAVQRSINAARKKREESAGDYSFDPKDVFLDW